MQSLSLTNPGRELLSRRPSVQQPTQRLSAWRSSARQFLASVLTVNPQTIVQQLQAASTRHQWKVYDPITGRTCLAESQAEARIGFEQRYYYLIKRHVALKPQ